MMTPPVCLPPRLPIRRGWWCFSNVRPTGLLHGHYGTTAAAGLYVGCGRGGSGTPFTRNFTSATSHPCTCSWHCSPFVHAQATRLLAAHAAHHAASSRACAAIKLTPAFAPFTLPHRSTSHADSPPLVGSNKGAAHAREKRRGTKKAPGPAAPPPCMLVLLLLLLLLLLLVLLPESGFCVAAINVGVNCFTRSASVCYHLRHPIHRVAVEPMLGVASTCAAFAALQRPAQPSGEAMRGAAA